MIISKDEVIKSTGCDEELIRILIKYGFIKQSRNGLKLNQFLRYFILAKGDIQKAHRLSKRTSGYHVMYVNNIEITKIYDHNDNVIYIANTDDRPLFKAQNPVQALKEAIEYCKRQPRKLTRQTLSPAQNPVDYRSPSLTIDECMLLLQSLPRSERYDNIRYKLFNAVKNYVKHAEDNR